jgi:plastocyanin
MDAMLAPPPPPPPATPSSLPIARRRSSRRWMVWPAAVVCAAALIGAVSGVAALVGDDKPAPVAAVGVGGASGAEPATVVTIADFSFSTLSAVAPGSIVNVQNIDSAPHTVTADDGSFDTGTLDSGAAARFTAPSAPGTYTFACAIHPSMTGTLVVEG